MTRLTWRIPGSALFGLPEITRTFSSWFSLVRHDFCNLWLWNHWAFWFHRKAKLNPDLINDCLNLKNIKWDIYIWSWSRASNDDIYRISILSIFDIFKKICIVFQFVLNIFIRFFVLLLPELNNTSSLSHDRSIHCLIIW